MTSSKAQLRKHMRQQRRALDAPAQRVAANAVSSLITGLPGWSGVSRIALYLANDGEIETAALAALCRSEGKQLFLPVITNENSLEFATWDSNITLEANRFGIPEPGGDAERCSASALDIVIMPLVAWDLQGGRLGMGSGFYDRALAGVSGPLLVGLAHAMQQVSCVPSEPWDIAMDFVVTDTALHRCKVETN
jgi:5-formyltetrahydrofolate cyclo-ligase